MKLKKLLKGFLLAYGAVSLINDHADDISNWLDRKAQELARKAGEKYNGVEPELKFKRIWTANRLSNGCEYYARFDSDLLAFIYNKDDERHRINFENHDCYILVEE